MTQLETSAPEIRSHVFVLVPAKLVLVLVGTMVFEYAEIERAYVPHVHVGSAFGLASPLTTSKKSE